MERCEELQRIIDGYVAKRLSENLNETPVNLTDCIKENKYEFTDDCIGIISPTYNWGLPSIVKEFLERTEFHTSYLYLISTYGTTPGASDAQARRLIKGKVSAFYSVKMHCSCYRNEKQTPCMGKRKMCNVPWLSAPLP